MVILRLLGRSQFLQLFHSELKVKHFGHIWTRDRAEISEEAVRRRVFFTFMARKNILDSHVCLLHGVEASPFMLGSTGGQFVRSMR